MLGCWDRSCVFETSWENDKKKPKQILQHLFPSGKPTHSCCVSWKGKNNHYSNDNLPLSLPGWTNEDQHFNTPCCALGLETGFQRKCFTRQMTGHLTEWKMQQTELMIFTSIFFSSPPKKLRVIPRQLTNPQNHLSNHDLHVRLIRRPLTKWRAFKVGASSSFTYSGLITGDKYRKDSQAEIDGSGMAREVFYRSLAMDIHNEWWLS